MVELHHCYLTEEFRRLAHKSYYFNFKLPSKSQVFFFHSVKSSDGHLIIQEIGKLGVGVDAFPLRIEKFMQFNLANQLKVCGYFQFMSISVENVTANLPYEAFKCTEE